MNFLLSMGGLKGFYEKWVIGKYPIPNDKAKIDDIVGSAPDASRAT